MRLLNKRNVLMRMTNSPKTNGYIDYKGKYLFTDGSYGCVLTDSHGLPKYFGNRLSAETVDKALSVCNGKPIEDLTEFDRDCRDYEIDLDKVKSCLSSNGQPLCRVIIGRCAYNPRYILDLACVLRPDDAKKGKCLVHYLPKENALLWIFGYCDGKPAHQESGFAFPIRGGYRNGDISV